MATATEQKYLTVEQVATLLGVTHKLVRRRIASGELPAVQLGGKGHGDPRPS